MSHYTMPYRHRLLLSLNAAMQTGYTIIAPHIACRLNNVIRATHDRLTKQCPSTAYAAPDNAILTRQCIRTTLSPICTMRKLHGFLITHMALSIT
ncbi:hypothetical protein [Chitinophaga sp. S165]|uniref:hypothetical protein n=1 Tax=Chitinophaga sp. S165 TaxID=2135462 RepID=UPI0011B715FC|nr:hypothetical protein [Chitinophaga sp. S165]